jgi:hypothetical protein
MMERPGRPLEEDRATPSYGTKPDEDRIRYSRAFWHLES